MDLHSFAEFLKITVIEGLFALVFLMHAGILITQGSSLVKKNTRLFMDTFTKMFLFIAIGLLLACPAVIYVAKFIDSISTYSGNKILANMIIKPDYAISFKLWSNSIVIISGLFGIANFFLQSRTKNVRKTLWSNYIFAFLSTVALLSGSNFNLLAYDNVWENNLTIWTLFIFISVNIVLFMLNVYIFYTYRFKSRRLAL